MDSLSIFAANLSSPPVIAFFTGIAAVWAKSDLKFPAELYQGLTIYLLLAIGFKGGASLSQAAPTAIVVPIIVTCVMGTLISVLAFAISRWFLKLDVTNAAAMAAHYGSVSAVTFMACLAFLEKRQIAVESFMPALMAVMEVPAIVVSIMLARYFTKDSDIPFKECMREVLTGKSIVLIVCGLAAGLLSGSEGLTMMEPFFITPFYGVLMIFLLEMGLVAGSKLKDARKLGWGLVVYSVTMPLVNGSMGLIVGKIIGLSQGGSVVFAVLLASASYIAAPAAVRIALPKANPGYYITASLGITFPFNLLVGVPLFFTLSQWLF